MADQQYRQQSRRTGGRHPLPPSGAHAAQRSASASETGAGSPGQGGQPPSPSPFGRAATSSGGGGVGAQQPLRAGSAPPPAWRAESPQRAFSGNRNFSSPDRVRLAAAACLPSVDAGWHNLLLHNGASLTNASDDTGA